MKTVGRALDVDFTRLKVVGLPPSALPGISPSRGEIDVRQGRANLNISE
ncbi:hypothetical protein O3S81_14850 [Agrobacterium sp. SOY23]|nr:hypothetical protein [Agrobacterium sp. SOY23]MCZ4430983.1 hypothetical protein [Agrobacterium sp. SOY23]